MARPIKNTADYFPHETNKRDDPKIKAVRRKFGAEGYATYFMLQEFIGAAEFFEFRRDALTLEIIAGDFAVDPQKLGEMLDYFITLDLIQCDAETHNVTCSCLENSLGALLSKRKRERIEVIVADNTQSKVKESTGEKSKVKKSKENTALFEVPITLPFRSEQFQTAWSKWTDFNRIEKRKKLPPSTIALQLKKLAEMSEETAIKSIMQSIEKNWIGLFEFKENGNGKNQGIEKYSGTTAHNLDGADYSKPI